MTDAYQWTTDDDEIALDAVMVGIGGTSMDMLAAGLSYVEPTASIYWSAWLGPTDRSSTPMASPGHGECSKRLTGPNNSASNSGSTAL